MGCLNLCSVLAVVLFLQFSVFGTAQKDESKWLTLKGSPPLVIARNGFSGLFPPASSYAYNLAMMTSVPDLVLWCDVQLTKDGVGICFRDLMLDNSSTISFVYPKRGSTYNVNGVEKKGYFPVDFTLKDLTPNDAFYSQHKLSMRSFLLSASKTVIISHISSSEVAFLRGLAKPFASTKTKLVFRFRDQDLKEPSTNQTYGSLLKNLTMIKSFASGILVPKTYIWPVDSTLYLQPHTSLVADAHKIGLEVFATDFANDASFSYNYSYNPVDEYLSFIDNGDFSVDGLLSDFPITPSEAIAKPLVISHDGASGDYPGCTDVAYKKAIEDGADVIDCTVQISKDGTPFCMSSVNLLNGTSVGQSQFRTKLSTVDDLQSGPGIFSFSLDWADIQGLTPVITNPYPDYFLYRNPKSKSDGKIVSLADFLGIAKKATSLHGVLIRIENARYLAAKEGFNVTAKVSDALEKAGFNSPKAQKVMIQSSNSSVLKAMKGKNYELVYHIDEGISGAPKDTVAYIKSFADSVAVNKLSVFPTDGGFLTAATDVVQQLQSAKLPVYVHYLKNEFVSQAYDFFSDPIVEINSFVMGAGVDGPKTPPIYMSPVQPGQLMQLISPTYLPPAEAPNPLLNKAEVTEAPLPPAIEKNASSPSTAEPPKAAPNSQQQISASAVLSFVSVAVAAAMLWLTNK
ncbi:Glycerophosphodiester phosphodiesterase GDPDL3 [Bienertia sinuspersici]